MGRRADDNPTTHGGRREGAGRPRGSIRRPPSEVMAVRVSVEIAAAFDERARARGETRTEALRRLVERAAATR